MDPLGPLQFVPLLAWLAVAAIAIALLEIQIEGSHGWASSLPTWRYGPPWIRRLLNGKDLTGYHVYLWLTLLALFHLPVLFVGWTLALELTLLSGFATFAALWDALWFALNPAVGRDRRRIAWWFRRWIGPYPTDYYLALAGAAVLAVARGLLPGAPVDQVFGSLPAPLQHLAGWAAGLAVAFGIGIVAAVIHRRARRPRHTSYVMNAAEALARAGPVLTGPVAAGLRPPAAHPALPRPTLPGSSDALVELVTQEERLRKAQWLVQFAEILFSIVIGLSLERIGASNLFRIQGSALVDTLALGLPVILLYAWIVVYMILYWFNMRVELPVFAIFIRQISGIQHLVLVVVLGLIFFQAFDAALIDFSTATSDVVAEAVNRVLTWLGILVLFDLVAQLYLRSVWLRSCERLERAADPIWQPFLPRIRRYYGRKFPIKTISIAIVYAVCFLPGIPGSGALRYPLLTALGVATPLVVAALFVAVNLAFELYLDRERRIVHEVAARLAIELRRLDFEGSAGAGSLMPTAEDIVELAAEPGTASSSG